MADCAAEWRLMATGSVHTGSPPLVDRGLGRAPRQSRSRATLTRITEAAEHLFGERGYDRTTVADIAAMGRCSVGSFYARFHNKEALLLHVHDLYRRALIERIGFLCDLLRAENAGLEATVRQTVHALFRFARPRRRLMRLFIERSVNDPAFRLRHARAWTETCSLLRPLFLARRREIVHADPEGAVEAALRLIHAGWIADALEGNDAAIGAHAADDPLMEGLAVACFACLGVGVPPRGRYSDRRKEA